MRATWTGIFLLITLATASAWWLSSMTRDPVPSGPARGPDWYFDDASLTAMDEEGSPRYRLHARSIVHSPGDGAAHVDTVHMEWLQGDPIRIHADNARVSADGVHVLLAGGVRIVDDTGAGRMELVTTTLNVDADRHVAHTPDAVAVYTPAGTLEARGLYVDSRTGRIRLDRDVRGHYVPR